MQMSTKLLPSKKIPKEPRTDLCDHRWRSLAAGGFIIIIIIIININIIIIIINNINSIHLFSRMKY